MSNFIPIYKYAQDNNVSMQTIYRQIRERKIPDDKIKRIKVEKDRILISDDFQIVVRKKNE